MEKVTSTAMVVGIGCSPHARVLSTLSEEVERTRRACP
jgi:hypothetical protein